MPTIHRPRSTGSKRYAYFRQHLASQQYELTKEDSILDFGCGAGAFLLEAIENGHEARGVEVDRERLRQFLELAPAQYHDRFELYTGDILPFQNNTFSLSYSWFVFEHVPNLGLSLRELVRVTRPSGVIDIYADDVRNNWDGHACIPWPAYMTCRFTEAYLNAFNLNSRKEFINETVFYISAPLICDILTTLGCEILYTNKGPTDSFFSGEDMLCDSEKAAHALGLKVKSRLDAGLVASPAENLHVTARKFARDSGIISP
jgi:ubiquinone/menaquinone biosynthesis C-methylase UbiE